MLWILQFDNRLVVLYKIICLQFFVRILLSVLLLCIRESLLVSPMMFYYPKF